MKTAIETWPPYVFNDKCILVSDDAESNILCLNLKTLKIESRRLNIVTLPAPREWYEVCIEHRWKQIQPRYSKVLILNESKIKLIDAQDVLKLKGDIWIATPAKLLEENKDNNKLHDLLSYVCYFIGDGHRKKNKSEIVLAVENIGVFNKIRDLCKNCFDYDIPNAKIWETRVLESKSSAFNIPIGASYACKFLDVLNLPAGKKADIVAIPNKLLELPMNSLIKYGLSALIDTDGSVGKDSRISYATISWILALQVYSVFLRASTYAKLNKIYQPLNGKIFPRYVVRIGGQNQFKKLKKIGLKFEHTKKEQRLQEILEKQYPIFREQGLAIPLDLIKDKVRSTMKIHKIEGKTLSEETDLPTGTIKYYLAPKQKDNLQASRARIIIKALENISCEHLLDLRRLVNSDIYWCKLRCIKKIQNPGLKVITRFKSEEYLPIKNLIFMS